MARITERGCCSTGRSSDSAKTALNRIRQKVIELKKETPPQPSPKGREYEEYKQKFLESINDDLNMPEVLAVLWGVVRDEKLSAKARLELIYDFDKVLGLDLEKSEEKKSGEAPEEVMSLVNQRTEAKKAKNFKLADELRAKVKEMGWEIVDKKEGAEVKSIKN